MLNLYIIPGFRESTDEKPYQKIAKVAQNKGYRVIFHNPQWTRRTIKDWLDELDGVIKKHGANDSMILGFSMGAYIAVLSAQRNSFTKLILCSLSPYFKEDLAKLPLLAHQTLGKRRVDAYAKFTVPRNIQTPVVFVVGNQDLPILINRVKDLCKHWLGDKKIVVLAGVTHDINNQKYLEAIYSNL